MFIFLNFRATKCNRNRCSIIIKCKESKPVIPALVQEPSDAALQNGGLRCWKCGVLPPKSIYAVEMRLKRILEAVAERIRCSEAHRNS